MGAEVIAIRNDAECEEFGAFLADRIYEFNAKATGYFDGMLPPSAGKGLPRDLEESGGFWRRT